MPRSFLHLRALSRTAGVALAGLLAGCAFSGAGVIDALTPKSGYALTADVPYGPDARQRLDVYRPVELPADGRAPVVLFIYGGSWREGSKAEYRFVADALTSCGIVTVIADYRLYPAVSYPAMLDDPAAAAAWTLTNVARYGGDPSRVFMAGHSAGAYDAAMVAFDPRRLAPYGLAPSRFAGFVGLAGPYNFLPIEDPGVKQVFHWPDTPADSQPIHHVDAHSPPSLLLAARHDTYVYPDRNTGAMADALKAAGVDTTVAFYDHVNHITLIGSMAWPLRFLAPTRRAVCDFVQSHGRARTDGDLDRREDAGSPPSRG